ncbi:MAG TPA: hypothetical protein VHF07_06470 [Nitrospiraceae bacterium]|nr:hypothetical protein [Nitrospiraceae bacterium]
MVEKIRVQRPSILFVSALFITLSLGWTAQGWSGTDKTQSDEAKQISLPRSFQGARLGMTHSELSAVVPEVQKLASGPGRRPSRTVVVSTKRDAYVERVEYRFFQGALKDLVIHYKKDRLPRGYDSLLDKLKKSYGAPVAQNILEYDPRADVFSVKKTVWRDDATEIVLSERQRMQQGEEIPEVVVTMTDRALQEVSERLEEERRRKQELAVPVPLENPSHYGPRSTKLGSARTGTVTAS